MKTFIPQRLVNLILFLSLFGVFAGCNASTSAHLKEYQKKSLILSPKEKIIVYIASSDTEQKRGLSKIKSSDFSKNEGMLFPANRMFKRQFWMPETFFNLDIFFLNQDYFVIDIQRNLQHFPQREPKKDVPLSRAVFSQHVLELRSDSEMSKKITIGMKLDFNDLN